MNSEVGRIIEPKMKKLFVARVEFSVATVLQKALRLQKV